MSYFIAAWCCQPRTRLSKPAVADVKLSMNSLRSLVLLAPEFSLSAARRVGISRVWPALDTHRAAWNPNLHQFSVADDLDDNGHTFVPGTMQVDQLLGREHSFVAIAPDDIAVL